MSTLAGAVDVHVSTISIDEQGLLEMSSHSEQQGQPYIPLSRLNLGFHIDLAACGSAPLLFVPSAVSTRSHLGRDMYLCTYGWLSCSTSKQQGFQKKPLDSLQPLGDNQQTACRMTDGLKQPKATGPALLRSLGKGNVLQIELSQI